MNVCNEDGWRKHKASKSRRGGAEAEKQKTALGAWLVSSQIEKEINKYA
jgi:hypothetical protein